MASSEWRARLQKLGWGWGFAAGAGAALIALALLGLTLVYSGAYNVAATEGHGGAERWLLHTTMHNSVRARAGAVSPPDEITPDMIVMGAGEYKAMCQQCHGGPGVDREAWAEGLTPRPPRLTRAGEWERDELYWIVRYGVRMTGMPAFGPSHDEQTLWSIAAFVEQLPEMTPEQYAAYPVGHADGGVNGATHVHEDGASHTH